MQSFKPRVLQRLLSNYSLLNRLSVCELSNWKPNLASLCSFVPYLIKRLPLGEKLLSLLQRTRLLEEHLLQEIQQNMPARLSVALNRDSLETWFNRLLAKLRLLEKINIDIITDDQEVTIDYFRQGSVSTCITSYAKALPGCECVLLGYMDYLLVASPDFIRRNFSNQKTLEENLAGTPVIIFDNRDRLPEQYFKHFFNKSLDLSHHHTVPSVQGYKQFALQGYGYGLIPHLDIVEELAKGELVEICPDKPWLMPLYWHYWQLPARQYQRFIEKVTNEARHFLIPLSGTSSP